MEEILRAVLNLFKQALPSPNHKRIFITPEIAKTFLASMAPNRVLSRSRVDRLAEIMRKGYWCTENGECLKFDALGRLIDGQHRLHAIIKLGAGLWMELRTDCATDAMQTLDRPRKRTNADDHAIRGEHNTKGLSATIGWIYKYEARRIFSSKLELASKEEEAFLAARPEIKDSIRFIFGDRFFKALGTGSGLAFCHYIFGMESSVEVRDQFFEALRTGAALEANSPIYLLRERLLSNQKKSYGALGPLEIVALTFKAFKVFSDGGTLKYLRWRRKGPDGSDSGAEAFPYLTEVEVAAG